MVSIVNEKDKKSPQKIFYDVEIERRRNEKSRFTWKEIKDFQFEDEDVVQIGYDEGYCSENNSWDPYYYFSVTRKVIETDEQFTKRIEHNKWLIEDRRKQRYENYLKMKKEFEPDEPKA